MTVVNRRLLFTLLALVVAVAILTSTAEAALVYHAVGPICAAALGVALLPAMAHGASSGSMRARTAWAIGITGCVLCLVATIGLDPDEMDCVTISWYTCGVLAGAVMVWMAGHRMPPIVAVTCMLLQVTAWAGPLGMIRLGLGAEIVLVIAGVVLHRAVQNVTAVTEAANAHERETTIWQAEQDAFHLERELRLHRAGRNATPMLQRIIDRGGRLDDVSRATCRVLEQTLRDEIRGRRLLNDAVRREVHAQRDAGTFVQVLDDGGLDDLAPSSLAPLLDELAERITAIRSSRIVIRTGRADSTTAITIVATTPDETAVALGLDDDEQVDLWATIARPAPALVAG